MPTTTFTVSTESDLDNAIQLVDEGGADAADTAYTIDIAGPIDLGAVLPAVDLASGSSLTIAGIGGAQAETLGDGSEAGLVVSAGNVTVENLTIANAVAQPGGTLVIGAGATASGTVIQQGGTLDLQQGGVLAGSVAFAGGGTLEIDGTTMPTAKISGFGTAGTIDLTGIAFDPAGSAVLTSGNVLQIREDGQTVALQLDPAQSYAGHGFSLASDGHGGTDLVDPVAPTLTTLVSFNGTNGAYPFAGLIADAAGDLFGTTSGYTNGGTVFEINTAPDFPNYASTPTTLWSFEGTDGDGYEPLGGLIADAAGDLFGTTNAGGANGDGNVFEIANFGGFGTYDFGATTLVSFNGTDGAGPDGNLIADAAGDLFGTTSGNIQPIGEPFETINDGTVFEIANTGTGYASTPTTLASFDGANGANPTRGLIADAAGDLFGTTQGGGAHGDGTVFELANTGSGSYTLRTLVSFNGTDGNTPDSGVIADAAGDLFGTTVEGGANTAGSQGNLGYGTVFELVNNGGSYALKTLVSFQGGVRSDGSSYYPNPNGAYPLAGLIADAVGNLFGTTSQGGFSIPNQGLDGDGTVFELVNNGGGSYASTPTTLVSFGGNFGASPGGGALIAHGIPGSPGVALFGTTQYGGANQGQGTAFELTLPPFAFVAFSPTITGTKAGQTTTSEAPVTPFSAVTIGDPNPGATDTLTITVGKLSIDGGLATDTPGGTLTGTGLSPVRFSPGVFTLSGTAVAITGELDALSFAPTGGGGNPNTTSTFISTLTLSAVSSAYGPPAVTTTTVIDTDPAITDTTVPTETMGGPYSGNENTPITLGGLSVSASPNTGDLLTTVLSVGDGTLTATAGGGSAMVSVAATAMLTLTGTAANINEALATASYTGNPDTYGSDTLSVTTTDTADGNQASASAAITVNEILDPAGYYYPGSGATAAIIDPVGTYTDMPGLSAPIPAPPGSYVATAGATAATLALPGYYDPGLGNASAIAALAGYYVGTTGATAATQDTPGTFTAMAGSSAATQAPPGSYVATAGATAATLALPGYYDPGLGNASAIAALAGYYVGTTGATAATQDTPGTFTAMAGSSAATQAPPGSYVATAGATAATLALPGYYDPGLGNASAIAALAGYYVGTTGATAATQDTPGTFTAIAGSSAATQAPPGSYVATAGATAATLALPGYYDPGLGNASAIAALAGYYVGTTGATAATQDTPGTFTAMAGSSAATQAPPGSYVATAGATAATLALPGYYDPGLGNASAIAAPPDTYVATPGATAPTHAQPGFYDPGYGNTAPIPLTVAVSINPNVVNLAHNTATVTFAFVAAPTSFVLADTTASGGTLGNLQQVSATQYTATFTAAANTDTSSALVGVTAGSWSEINGNAGAGGTTGSFVVDTVIPTPGTAHLYIAPGQSFDLTSPLLALDAPGLSLTAVGTSGTTGTVTLNHGDLSYKAPASGSTDAFTYTVSDQLVPPDSSIGTVNVTLDPNLLKNDNITLTGSGNIVDGGNGNDSVSLTGNNDTLTFGGGNDNVSLTGNSDTLTLGNGNDTVTVSGTGESVTAGTGNDTFTLGNNSTASLVLHGMHDTVSVNGGTDSITDTPGASDALTLQIGTLGGTVGAANFSPAHGVLLLAQALATAEHWTTPGQVAAALTKDNSGAGPGSLLSLGAFGSVDFQNVPKAQLSAANFQIH